jgi:hypothetical protein
MGKKDHMRSALGRLSGSTTSRAGGLHLWRRAAEVAAAHGPFVVVLTAGITLRVFAVRGYPTVAWFGDSGTYLDGALQLTPSELRPSGYSIFLWLLGPLHSLYAVVVVQHLLGVLTGMMLYGLVWRAAAARWPQRVWPAAVLGALVTVPVLLDAYQIQLEQLLMSDELFLFLTFAAISVALWRDRLPWWAGALTGLLTACCALTRSVGLPLLVVLVVGLLIRRAGWRAPTAAVLVFAVPMIAYGFWFKASYQIFALSRTDQIWLYGRTVAFADCAKMKPPSELWVLCRNNVPQDPQVAPAYAAMWGENSGFRVLPPGIGGEDANRLAGEFAWLAIRKQPGDYLGVVLRDTFRSFEWNRQPYPTPWTVGEYTFPAQPVPLSHRQAQDAYAYGGATATPRIVEPYAGWMRGYQTWGYLRGTLLGVILLIGLGGIVANWRRWGGTALLPWLISLALLVVPAATADFDYRYVLPAAPFAALAAGLALIRPARARAAAPAENVAESVPAQSFAE